MVKDLNPTTDAGLFNLQIDGSTAAPARTSATTARRASSVNTGTHTVGETAGTSTDLADYQKSISCVAPRTATPRRLEPRVTRPAR